MASGAAMAGLLSLHAYNLPPTLSGYQQVFSERGRLYYLPEPLYQILFEDTPTPIVFQPREQRPHRIHIARIHPDYEEQPEAPFRVKRVSIAVFFAKLAGSKESAKKFLKSIILSDPENPRPQRPISWVSSRSAVGRRPQPGTWGNQGKRRSNPATMRSNIRNSISVPSAPAARSRTSIHLDDARSPTADSFESLPSSQFLGDKPLAMGNGVALNVALAEPVLFLQGYEQGDLQASRSTAMLRGSLLLRVSKPAKIKAVTLRFRGRAITKWPEGIPPKKTDFEETTTQMSHTWPFFNAQFPTAEHTTGADHVDLHRSSDDLAKNRTSIITLSRGPNPQAQANKELKRLSLQVNQARSFEKGGTPNGGQSVAQKGYRVFQPGDYTYNFELPLDSHLPETIDVDLGSVKYELEAIVERAGAFKTNLVGTKEVTVIRTPAEGSLEQVEPIAISRNWEDQLHYDIVISGKSFPLGAQVPIAFKLTPLAKVQCHRIKVFVTESVEYYCHNKRVHRMEPTRKIQLFEKRADSAPVSTFPGSTMRIISGGGVPYDMRAAAAAGEHVTIPEATNLLGDLTANSASIGPTEMEFNVQLPSCINTKDKDKSLRLHFDTTYSNIQVHHWIKIVMRLSRPDANDPTKRRHFEISIDSPFHILSCRATQANTSLPAYSSPESTSNLPRAECGCPGAPMRRASPVSFLPALHNISATPSDAALGVPNSPTSGTADPDTISSLPPRISNTAPTPFRHSWQPGTISSGLQRPQAAHISGPLNPALQRPMHIIRAPSFAPPSFDQEEPPPPLETPPPQYDTIASPTSGLADYFARLSDAYSTEQVSHLADHSDVDDSSESEGRRTPRGSGRVEQPLTPGAMRSSRSLDEARSWVPLGLDETMFRPRLPRDSMGSNSTRTTASQGYISAVASPHASRTDVGPIGQAL